MFSGLTRAAAVAAYFDAATTRGRDAYKTVAYENTFQLYVLLKGGLISTVDWGVEKCHCIPNHSIRSIMRFGAWKVPKCKMNS